jgi:hypothetical protein
MNDPLSIALAVRERFETEVQGDLEQLRDRCHAMSRALSDELLNHGFAVEVVVGQYKGADDDFEMDTSEMEDEDVENFDREAGFAHWWVEISGDDGQPRARLLDICADQFHPSRRDAFRVVDIPVDGSLYEWQDRFAHQPDPVRRMGTGKGRFPQ